MNRNIGGGCLIDLVVWGERKRWRRGVRVEGKSMDLGNL